MRTAGLVEQSQPNTDLQLFIPATQALLFNTGTSAGAYPTATAGIRPGSATAVALDAVAVAASSTVNFKFDLSGLLVRTGMLKSGALTSLSDQAFGTANGPGPNSTPGTSDPSGFGYSEIGINNSDTGATIFTTGSNERPPIASQFLPTLNGPFTNNEVTVGNLTTVSAISAKGTRIKWIDLIYSVSGVALTSIALQFQGITASPVGHDVLLAVLNAGFAVNSLTGAALAINSVHSVHRERCTIVDVNGNATSLFLTDGIAINPVLTVVTPAGSTADVAGIIVGCDYNLN